MYPWTPEDNYWHSLFHPGATACSLCSTGFFNNFTGPDALGCSFFNFSATWFSNQFSLSLSVMWSFFKSKKITNVHSFRLEHMQSMIKRIIHQFHRSHEQAISDSSTLSLNRFCAIRYNGVLEFLLLLPVYDNTKFCRSNKMRKLPYWYIYIVSRCGYKQFQAEKQILCLILVRCTGQRWKNHTCSPI